MESIIAAAITGILTLVGVIVANSRSQAVLEVKIDELSKRVDKHNEVLERTTASANTRESPEARGFPDDYAAAIICVLLVMFAGIAVMAHLVSGAQATDEAAVPEYKPTHDSMTYSLTCDGEMIRWYVMKDPDTQIEYLVNDRGRCRPRLDNYGNVMGLSYE